MLLSFLPFVFSEQDCTPETVSRECENLRIKTESTTFSINDIGDAYKYPNIKSIIFTSDSALKTIGSQVFRCFSGVTNIVFEEGNQITSLTENFNNLPLLTEVDLTNVIATDISFCFANCPSLTRIIIGKNIKEMSDICIPFLEEIVLSPENEAFKLIDGILYTANERTMILAICTLSGTVTLPENLMYFYEGRSLSLENTKIIEIVDNSNIEHYINFPRIPTLEKITIGKNVISIDDNVFANFHKLKTVIFPTSCKIQSFLAYSFSRTGIESLSLPSTVTFIGQSAFEGCVHLQSIFFNSVSSESIGSSTFKGCTSLKQADVSALGESMFENCINLDTVKINLSIIKIPMACFMNCQKLKKFELPDSVSIIESFAFQSCDLSEGFVISKNSNLNAIYATAFDNSKLSEFYFPAKLHTIDDEFPAFSSITKVEVHPSNPLFVYEDDILYSKDKKSIFIYLQKNESFTVPDSVESLLDGCFSHAYKTLHYLNLGKVQTIGSTVFHDCFIDKLIIPSTYDFKESPSSPLIGSWIREIEFSQNSKVTQLEDTDPTSEEYTSFFDQATLLEKVTLPKSLKYIGKNTFKNCIRLREIVIPDGCDILFEKGAFGGLPSLEELTIPGSTNSITSYSFDSDEDEMTTYNLRSVKVSSSGTFSSKDGVLIQNDMIVFYPPAKEDATYKAESKYVYITNANNLETIIVDDRVESLVMSNCQKLVSIQISENSNLVGIQITNCPKVTSIYLPKGITTFPEIPTLSQITCHANCKFSEIDGVIFEGNSLMRFPPYLNKQNYEISADVSSISTGAFSECHFLESVTINDKIVQIPSNCFTKSSIKKVTIGKNVIRLLERSFAESSIETVEFPSDSVLDEINNEVFYNCKSLVTIALPDSVKFMYSQVFKSSGIKTFNCPAKLLQINNECFSDTPIESVNFSSVTKIDILSKAFSNCQNLREFNIPQNLGQLSSDAFYNCLNLETITSQSQKFPVNDGIVYYIDSDSTTVYIVPPAFSTSFTAEPDTKITPSAFSGCQKIDKLDLSLYQMIEMIDLTETIINELWLPPLSKPTKLNAKILHWAPDDNSIVIKNGILYEGSYPTKTIISDIDQIEILFGLITADSAFANNTATTAKVTGINTLSQSTFSNSKNLKSVTFETPVRTVGDRAFADCPSLTAIDFGDTGFADFGDFTFENTQIERMEVNTPMPGMFKNCQKLTSATFSGYVEDIPDEAFSGCFSLESFDIPSTATMIYQYAFKDCQNLKSVNFNGELVSFLPESFEGCTSLKSMTLFKRTFTMVAMQFHLFNEMSLEEIKLKGDGSATEINGGIYVNGMLLAYPTKRADRVFECPDFCTSVYNLKNCLFEEFSASWLSKLRYIGVACFKDSKLKKMTIPRSLEAIANDAFDGVEIEELSILGLKDQRILAPFKKMKSLKKINVAEGVEIDKSDFPDAEFETITVPTSLPVDPTGSEEKTESPEEPERPESNGLTTAHIAIIACVSVVILAGAVLGVLYIIKKRRTYEAISDLNAFDSLSAAV